MPRKKRQTREESAHPSATTDGRRDPLNTAQVANMFQVNVMTLRYWLEQEKIPTPRRNPLTGAFLWAQKDVDALAAYIRQQEGAA
jgi:hypothetical protein